MTEFIFKDIIQKKKYLRQQLLLIVMKSIVSVIVSNYCRRSKFLPPPSPSPHEKIDHGYNYGVKRFVPDVTKALSKFVLNIHTV